MFAESLPVARRYAECLGDVAVQRGLLGPREVSRIWERHLLNCAVVADAAPMGARVADVGSGAGLPGLVWAIRRPDLSIVLVEPMSRRIRFLREAIAALRLDSRVGVVRGRAEAVRDPDGFDVVTSRAVAGLDRLIRWCAPLCRPHGRIVAIKGRTAAEELAGAADLIGRVTSGEVGVRTYGSEMLHEPASAVEIVVTRPHGLAE